MMEVPGQPRTKRFLRQLLRTGRAPHALLFSGMAGIGKGAMALQFAKALNCLNPVDLDSCDACSSCRKADGSVHPDIVLVQSEGASIKVDQIRALRERCRFRPFEGRYRVIFIQEAQNLRDEGANALLKLLEEPPAGNLFVLTVLEPQMLLPTIVSRCCHVRFQPLEDSYIERHLMEALKIPSNRAKELSVLAEGSLAKARWLAEENRSDEWERVVASIRRLNGISIMDFFDLTAQWAKNSEDLEQDLNYIKLWLRDIILARSRTGHRAAFELDAELPDIVERTPGERLLQLYGSVEEALQHLRQNANRQLVLESVCFKIKDSLYGQGSRNSFSQRG